MLLIMLLQLSYFSPLPLLPGISLPSSNLPLSSCPWVMHINTLASPFPILSLTPACLFCFYRLCFLFPAPFSPLFSIEIFRSFCICQSLTSISSFLLFTHLVVTPCPSHSKGGESRLLSKNVIEKQWDDFE